MIRRVRYTADIRAWLAGSDHYLGYTPPGCVLAFGYWEHPAQPIKGLILLGRPSARALPQDGSWLEITRLYLEPGAPYGTASELIRYAIRIAFQLGTRTVISYHDRTRHSGCIYRKAGMRKDGVTEGRIRAGGRTGASVATGATSKRRWRIDNVHV